MATTHESGQEPYSRVFKKARVLNYAADEMSQPGVSENVLKHTRLAKLLSRVFHKMCPSPFRTCRNAFDEVKSVSLRVDAFYETIV